MLRDREAGAFDRAKSLREAATRYPTRDQETDAQIMNYVGPTEADQWS